jgi:adenylate kinase
MICGITGTPGTGKSAVSEVLQSRGHQVIRQNDTMEPYLTGTDEDRDARIVDADAWADEYTPTAPFIEGHLVHLLACDRVVVLRCRPDRLRARLEGRGYSAEKIRENCEAEAMDLILSEAYDIHGEEKLLEIDTTDRSPEDCADLIEGFVSGTVPPSCGSIDWSAMLGDLL